VRWQAAAAAATALGQSGVVKGEEADVVRRIWPGSTRWLAAMPLLRSWLKEERRLPRGRRTSPGTLAGFGLLLAGLLAIDGVIRHRLLEREHEARLQEAVAILTATLAGVERSALDWAHWNNMYDWVQGRNPSFVHTDVETTPLFDEGGLFLIFNRDGSSRLSFGHKGHDHPSYRALFSCAQRHLDRLPSVLSRISLLCRSDDAILFLGVATPLSNSTETAPALGTLVMFEPLLKTTYGPAFNRPLQWITRHMRRIESDGSLSRGSKASATGMAVAAALAPGEEREPLGLNRPLFTAGGQMITLSREAILPDLFRSLGRDLLLGLIGLGSLLGVRVLLLSERRRVRLIQRHSELESNRRIQRTSRDLDRLLARLAPSGTARTGEERVLARLIDKPPSPEAIGQAAEGTMERKLERLADRFQHFLEGAKHLALLDPLTQLPNRRYFIEQVQLQVETARGSNQQFAILFVDIDKFKNINDSYGHAIGDAALVLVADQLRSLTRSSDFLGRYGGDEFAILMDLDNGITVSDERLRQVLEEYALRIVTPFEQAVDLGGFRVELSISVGISLIKGCEPDLEAAMRRSDIAMYRAKQNSQNRIAIFDQSDDGTHLGTYQLYVDLMQAIRDRQFMVLFQPIVDRQGSIHSLEALSRWQHPQLGMIGPDVFVDLAERYRQMNVLSDELIGLSMQAYRELVGERSDLRISLNLPPSKLSDPQLLPELSRQLAQYGIAPSNLTIELTERSVLLPLATVTTNLKQMRAEGIAISLDDFGTGYSSLSLLSTLQPNEVKIDKSFVMAMCHDDYARQIITLIADMASRMDLQVVAEGVEDGQVLAMLQDLGIRYFQGFHFASPMPVAELRRSPLLSPGPQP
jgi:diguanylate cyclase (GGDEF)-like protein